MQFDKMKFKYFILPIAIALMAVTYFAVWRLLGLPPYKELVGIFQQLLITHGLWVIFAAALLEGMLLVGNYFPGGVVVFIAIIGAGNDFGRIALINGIVDSAFIVANVINYLLGYYGWYHLLVKFGMQHHLEEAEGKWKQKSFKVIFLSYWQSNLAALTATAAGILRIDFKKFLFEASFGVVFWHICWTVLIYFFREQAVNAITNIYVLSVAAISWAIYVSVMKYRKDKDHANINT